MIDTVETKLPIQFSASAISALKEIMQNEQVSINDALRVGVKGGGCSGMSYVLGFENEFSEFDDFFVIDDLKIVMDRRHSLYLLNMNIDYQDGLNARGFVFQNPNAKSTCGCGTSFSA